MTRLLGDRPAGLLELLAEGVLLLLQRPSPRTPGRACTLRAAWRSERKAIFFSSSPLRENRAFIRSINGMANLLIRPRPPRNPRRPWPSPNRSNPRGTARTARPAAWRPGRGSPWRTPSARPRPVACGTLSRPASFSAETPPLSRSNFEPPRPPGGRAGASRPRPSGSNSSAISCVCGGPVTVHPPASFGSTSITVRPALRSARSWASRVKPAVPISTIVCGTPPSDGGTPANSFCTPAGPSGCGSSPLSSDSVGNAQTTRSRPTVLRKKKNCLRDSVASSHLAHGHPPLEVAVVDAGVGHCPLEVHRPVVAGDVADQRSHGPEPARRVHAQPVVGQQLLDVLHQLLLAMAVDGRVGRGLHRA